MAEAVSYVPQGSVLGSSMFVIYGYDLANDLTTDPLLCAGELERIAPQKQTVPWPLVPNGPRTWS